MSDTTNMFDTTKAFGGFSVDDIPTAKRFYSETLGLKVEEIEGGMLNLRLDSGAVVLIYPKGAAHQPASFTILNFGVADVEKAVEALNAKGIDTKIYPEMGDDKGIQRDYGPDIAWFTDPAGNILSVIASGEAR